MGQYRTQSNAYLESQVSDLQHQVLDYKAKENYAYGRGQFGHRNTFKIYCADIITSAETYYQVQATLTFEGHKENQGAYPFTIIEMYNTADERIENNNNIASSTRVDIPPTLNKSLITVSGHSRYGSNQRFYLLVKCFSNVEGSFEIDITSGSLDGYSS